MATKSSSGGSTAHTSAPGNTLTRHDAHRYLGAAEGEDRCSICGEPRVHIRHHPTRVRAALLVRGLDPDAAGEALAIVSTPRVSQQNLRVEDERSKPMTIEVRLLGRHEAAVLDRVAPDVFDEPVDRARSAEFLADVRHHLAVALDGDLVVGMASAVDYVHPDKPVELWINEVGVAPGSRRTGLGRRLLEALFERGRELGCREAWVGTEHDNDAARGLYAAVGGRSDPFIMYSFELAAETDED